jgi:DUF4097 and DUF4098 domain-containing protein YvlB
MKADIKKMVEEQKSYRLQRKYKLPEGMERTVSQSEAQWKHRANRQKLRTMYAAYTVARNKSISLIDRHPEEIEDQAFKILTKYEIQVPVEQPQE